MSYDPFRREFLKKSTMASFVAMMTSMGIPKESHAAALSIASLASLIQINPIDLEYKTLGPCCPICPGTMIVNHYMPVAFVEVIKGPTDSLIMDFGAASGAGIATNLGTIDKDYLSSQFSVRIWDIPYYVTDMAMGGQACKLCDRSKAMPLPAQEMSVVSSLPIEIACGGGNLMQAAIGQMMNKLKQYFPLQCVPSILYDSSFDPSWRQSCRDVATAAALSGTSGLMCNDLTGSILGSIGVDITGGLDPCIGGWGPLYPRQMRTDGQDVLTAAAISAYRALHVAGFSTGTMPYRVDLGGKLKWVSPVPTLAMTPGTPKQIFNAGQFVTPQHQYGFTWWAPVSCCKDVLTLAAPCIPAIPCQGSSLQ